jgi:hypothetical protein
VEIVAQNLLPDIRKMVHKTFFKSDVLPSKKVKKIWKPKPRKSTGERELFASVWASCDKRCEICGEYIYQPAPWSFAHRAPKGTYPEYKLVPTNLSIVCSLECHASVDRQRKQKMAEWVAINEKWLSETRMIK